MAMGSVQQSLCMFFTVMINIQVFFIDEDYFYGWNVISSAIAVFLAHLVFQIYYHNLENFTENIKYERVIDDESSEDISDTVFSV